MVAIAPGMFLAHSVVPSSDLRAGVHADLLANEQHRRLVALAFADHNGALDRQLVELAPHRVDRGLVGLFLLAVAAQPCRRYRRALRHPHDLERENAFEQQLRRNRNMGRHWQTPLDVTAGLATRTIVSRAVRSGRRVSFFRSVSPAAGR
jgi:class 3 adenylate cyclase